MTLPQSKASSTYIVKYMNYMGRAALVRSLLHLSGAQYKNVFVTSEEIALNRAEYPFGLVPILIETRPDGTTFELAEAMAIEQYLAEKLGFLGSTPEEAAVNKSVALNVYLEHYPYCFDSSPEKRRTFEENVLPRFLESHTRWLVKNGNNGHYFGEMVSYADLAMAHWIRLIDVLGYNINLDGWTKEQIQEGQEQHPLRKLEKVISELPEWQGQYDNFHPTSSIVP
ncbi:hypothetical protein BGW38_000032 [Lunasporangiospora selenospora]|uniref:GST N-terminal domain-containing protein n=1 Tax=Lunasporangiospora selenospora TaxID=979761 RepID=A0A9P6KIY8_9FUNG|nr:hypothetical protein BGW38_000032 [Lunasporangiospora selenospora]